MKRRPRSLFRSRRRGPELYIGPAANAPPKYLAATRELARGLGPGVHEVHIYHDDWCGVFKGRPCDCSPDVELAPGPERN